MKKYSKPAIYTEELGPVSVLTTCDNKVPTEDLFSDGYNCFVFAEKPCGKVIGWDDHDKDPSTPDVPYVIFTAKIDCFSIYTCYHNPDSPTNLFVS